VIEREPAWSLLTPRTPPYLIHLLRRCLEKDPKLRLRDIGEARIALANRADKEASTVPARRPWRIAIAALLAAVIAGSWFTFESYRRGAARSSGAAAPSVRFLVPPPDNAPFSVHPARTFFALSPDGSQLAFIAGERIWLRAAASFAARPVPGTENATALFWSPEGGSLAFFADRKLKRIDLPNGAVVPLADVTASFVAHGTWGRGGVILFSTGPGLAIFRVPASGGMPTEIVTPDKANGEVRVHWPYFLPDGQRFLYTARTIDGDGRLKIGDLGGSAARTLMPVASNAQWVEPDVVVFAREGVLMGQRVDLESARTIGEPFSVADKVDYILPTSRGLFSTSFNGSIAYHAHGDLAQLVWADQRGNQTGMIGDPADYEPESIRISADGRFMLTSRREAGFGTFDLWRRDLVRQTEERLTTDRGVELTPIFGDDDRTILYAADRGGSVPSVYRKDLVTGVEEQLIPNGLQRLVMDTIHRQRAVVYVERSPQGVFDIYKLSLEKGASPEPVLRSPIGKYEARVSFDGRAIAFAAAQEERDTSIYVAPLPVTSAPVLVASGATSSPRWGRDGRVYYVDANRQLTAVPVQTSPALNVGTPRRLFEVKRPALFFEVAPDGRIVLFVPQVRAADGPIHVATSAITGGRR
jgi:Tol biopolymer transport system component